MNTNSILSVFRFINYLLQRRADQLQKKQVKKVLKMRDLSAQVAAHAEERDHANKVVGKLNELINPGK